MKKSIFVLLFLSVFGNAFAKDLFVSSSSGSDATTYASNDSSHPWLTVAHAWGTAQSGDTVYYFAGSYVINDYNSYGDADNITHTNYGDDQVTWLTTSTTEAIRVENSYITVDGIDIDADTISAAEGGFFRIGYNYTAEHFTLKNGEGTVGACSDNGGLVHAKATRANYLTIQNYKITGAGSTAGSLNTACIWVSRNEHLLIQNCELSNAQCGIYFKHTNQYEGSIIIENNYIHDCNRGGYYGAAQYATIRNNLFVNANLTTGMCGESPPAYGTCGSDYNTFDHNTITNSVSFLQSSTGDTPGATYNTVTNSIIVETALYHPDVSGFILSHVGPDYNLYGAGSSAVKENGITYTLSAWQSHIDSNLSDYENTDDNSIAGYPTFVGGGSPSTIAGYALTSESYGYQACADLSDMGADVSLVGVDAGTQTAAVGGGMLSIH